MDISIDIALFEQLCSQDYAMMRGCALWMKMHANAGQGKEHAKWSPVATAWYKLLPEVVITKVWCPHCLALGQEDFYFVCHCMRLHVFVLRVT